MLLCPPTPQTPIRLRGFDLPDQSYIAIPTPVQPSHSRRWETNLESKIRLQKEV